MTTTIEPTTSTKRVIMLDASALKVSSCLKHLEYLYMHGLRNLNNTYKMDYGTAMHKYLAEYHGSNNEAEGLKQAIEYYSKVEVPPKDFRTAEHLTGTIMGYSFQYPAVTEYYTTLQTEKGPLVEQKFAVPFMSDDQFEFVLCGTIDLICQSNNGQVIIMDHKVTSSYNPQEYLEAYQLNPQLRMYVLILKKLAQLYPDTCKDLFTNPGAVINGIFISKARGTQYVRSREFYFDDADLAEFEYGIIALCRKISSAARGNNFIREGIINNSCETKFGLCPFAKLCCAVDDDMRQVLIDTEFSRVPYNPLSFGEA